MEGATSQLAVPDSGKMGGYHRPVGVETVVGPTTTVEKRANQMGNPKE